MAFDLTPWAITGGAQHSADTARMLCYAATGGNEGIVEPGSLKVTATGGSSVSVAPGACLMLNRSPGGAQQTYAARAGSATAVPIAPSSGARSDLVVVRVEDPQFPPWQQPANPAAATYVRPFVIQNVGSNVATAAQLGLGYPAIALARIDLPGNTSSITSSMITDLRRMAQPRTRRQLLTAHPTTTNTMQGETGGFVNWPTNAWTVEVPEWATRAVVHGTIAGARAGHTDPTKNGDCDVQVAILLGTQQTQAAQSEWLTVVSASGTRGYMRGDISTGGTLDVTSMRGQAHSLRFRGAIVNPDNLPGNQGMIRTDTRTTLLVDLEFQEAAS